MENSGEMISRGDILEDIRTLFLEAAVGPEDPRETWFTDNEEGSGILGSVGQLSAKAAFSEKVPGLDSIAAHVQHVSFFVNLAVRAYRGDNAYEGADWTGSWKIREKTPSEWQRILNELESAVNNISAELKRGIDLDVFPIRRGSMALVAHCAWHLGAIRQLLVLVNSPGQ